MQAADQSVTCLSAVSVGADGEPNGSWFSAVNRGKADRLPREILPCGRAWEFKWCAAGLLLSVRRREARKGKNSGYSGAHGLGHLHCGRFYHAPLCGGLESWTPLLRRPHARTCHCCSSAGCPWQAAIFLLT